MLSCPPVGGARRVTFALIGALTFGACTTVSRPSGAQPPPAGGNNQPVSAQAQQLINEAWQASKNWQCDLMASKIRELRNYMPLNDTIKSLIIADSRCMAITNARANQPQSPPANASTGVANAQPTGSAEQEYQRGRVPQTPPRPLPPPPPEQVAPRYITPPPPQPPTPEMQKYFRMLATALQEDSTNWPDKTLVNGSLRDLHVYGPGQSGLCYNQCRDIGSVSGRYTYKKNGGGEEYDSVWANASDVQSGRFTCLSYENYEDHVCHHILTAQEKARIQAGVEEEFQRRLRASQTPSSGPSSGSIKVPGPSMSFCNKITTGSFVSGALGNPWCD
jgi:hypothetical protein